MVAGVSLRDKIGQMLIMGFDGKKVDENSPIVNAIENDNVGGVILFDYNFQTQSFDKNIASLAQVQCLNNNLHQFCNQANAKKLRPLLPLLIAVDYEGGRVDRLKHEYGFPNTCSAAEVGKIPLAEAQKYADKMADTLKESGFNLNFAPALDVMIDPESPVIGKIGRSFSADPLEVADYASVFAQSFLSRNIQCAYKHFPGHGSANADSHLGFVDVTNTWQEHELTPFRHLLNAKPSWGMVMTAHIVNRKLDESGLPATLSHKILTGLLRQQLKYDGVIITDDMQMKAISDNYGLDQAIMLAINAGVDMFIFGNQLSDQPQKASDIIDVVERKVNTGDIDAQQINEAYRRIRTFKESLICPV